ncbi:hypothetical protein MMC06_002853 [Schaereria dolodes]|nr:hypothetical protein [Schaereria dolodes]
MVSHRIPWLIYGDLHQLLRHAQANSMLPFLYQTRTLQFSLIPNEPPVRKQGRLFTTSSRRAVIDKIPFGNPLSPSANSEEHPSYDFKSPFGDHFEESKAQTQKPRESTITLSEKEVFNRIFADIAGTRLGTQSEEHDLDDGLDIVFDTDEDLRSIFDAAVKESKAPKGGGSRRFRKSDDNDNDTKRPKFAREIPHVIDLSRFPEPLRKAAARANTAIESQQQENRRLDIMHKKLALAHSDNTSRTEEPFDIFEQRTERARTIDRLRVENLLDTAKTDFELWTILENEIFQRVQIVVEQIQEGEDKAVTGSNKLKKKRRSRKKEATQTPKAETSALLSTPIAMEAEKQSSLLSLLQTNYSLLCVFAIRIFRTKFPASPYAMNLLPNIKRLGPISYVLGASVDLYNELLYLRWVQYSDLHSVTELVNEMLDQGIGSNGITVKVLIDVERKRSKGTKGELGEFMKAWWSLPSQADAVSKVILAYQRLKKDQREIARQQEIEEEANQEVNDREKREDTELGYSTMLDIAPESRTLVDPPALPRGNGIDRHRSKVYPTQRLDIIS